MRVVRHPLVPPYSFTIGHFLLEWFVRAVATFSATINEYSELKIYHRLGLRFISIGSTSNDVVQIDVEEGQPRL